MEKIKKIYKSKYFPIIIFFILTLFIHVFINPVTDDDIFFKRALDNKDIIDFSINRYLTASSRNIIEMVLVTILRYSTIVWKVLDSLIFTIAIYSIFKIFIENTAKEKEKTSLLVALGLIYPIMQMNSAGWGATTLNYLWPVSLALYSFTYIKETLENKKIKWYKYILIFLSFLYACNHEQCCLIMIGLYLIFDIVLIKRKKMNVFIIFQNIILICMMIWIALSPGNSARAFDEIGNWLYDYGTYSFIDKAQLGLTSTISKLICEPNILFFIMTFLMMIYIQKSQNKQLYKIISIIPVVLTILLGIFKESAIKIFPALEQIYNIWTSNQLIISATNYNNIIPYIVLILSLGIVFCILIEMLVIFRKRENLIFLAILGLGFLSRFAMGMSPTIFASMDRTFIFLDFAFIITSIGVFNEITKKSEKNKLDIIINSTIIIAMIQYLNSFITILK